MSEEALEQLVVKLTADMNSFSSSLDRAVAKADETGKHIEKSLGGLITAGVVKAQIALELLKKGFEFVKEATVDMVKEQLAAVDHLAKLSDRTGIATEKLAMLQHVAEESGLTVDAMAMASQRLGKQLEAASKGVGPAADALRKLGVTVSQLKDLKPDEQLALIADGFKKLQSPAEKSAIAMELFGRSGLQMTGFLSKGSAAFEEAAKKTELWGLAISRIDAAKIEIVNNSARDLKDRMEGIARQLTLALAPALEAVINYFGDMMDRAGGAKRVVENLVENAVKYLGGFLDELRYLQIAWDYVKVGILSVIPALVEMDIAANNAIKGVVKGTLESIANLLTKVGDSMTAIGLKGAQIFQDSAGDIRRYSSDIQNEVVDKTSTSFMALDEALKSLHDDLEKPMPSTGLEAKLKDIEILMQRQAELRVAVAKDTSDKVIAIAVNEEQVKAIAADAGMNDLTRIENERYINEQAMSLAAFEQAHTSQGERDAITEKQAKRHADNLSKISNNAATQQANWERQTWQQKVGYTSSALGSIATLLEGHGKKSFEMGKKVAYAKAIIDVASGAASTIGEFGWYALLGPLEAVLAAGAVQIQQISQMQYGGGGGAPSGGGIGAGSLPDKQTIGGPGVTGQASGGQAINVTVVGDVFNANAFRSFAKQIDNAIRDGVRITGVRTN